jgi:hypothetical protein
MKFLPCPFCSHEGHEVIAEGIPTTVRVKCRRCGACGPRSLPESEDSDTVHVCLDDIVERYNAWQQELQSSREYWTEYCAGNGVEHG